MNSHLNQASGGEMSSMQAGRNEACSGNSRREEGVLLASLNELVVLGWKADNGFRPGYLNKLEEAMRKEYPDTDLNGMPHINSKISAWKKNYYSLSAMLIRSGVGFNTNGTFMIDCDNDQWEQIVKRDNNARSMRFKSWPLLEDWKEIFGKDRATGVNAEDVMEAVHEVFEADNNAQGGAAGSNHGPIDGEAARDEAENSVCQSDTNTGGAKVSRKKRKGRDEIDGISAALGEIGRNTNQRLDNLATRVGYEFDLGQARQTVFEQLGKINGLSKKEKFVVCEILADKVQRLEIFIGLPEDAKSEYVAYLLGTMED